MRRMYAKYLVLWDKKCKKTKLEAKFKYKPYHHIKLDAEFKADCKIWLEFLSHENLKSVVNRPMIDIDIFTTSKEICFYSDASAVKNLGFGCIYNKRWIFSKWEDDYVEKFKPGIEFLELFALCAGILTRNFELKDT